MYFFNMCHYFVKGLAPFSSSLDVDEFLVPMSATDITYPEMLRKIGAADSPICYLHLQVPIFKYLNLFHSQAIFSVLHMSEELHRKA
jgi:hypothetical protein